MIIATFNVVHCNDLELSCEVLQIELFPCQAHLFCLVCSIGLHVWILHVNLTVIKLLDLSKLQMVIPTFPTSIGLCILHPVLRWPLHYVI